MPPHPAPEQPSAPSLEGVRHTIAVASGKGGVGKSTTAINLALALRNAGGKPARIGVLDADVYGPSMALMFGLEGEQPHVDEKRRIVPLERFGVKVVSMAFLADRNRPVIWRGPMVHQILQQFVGGVAWGELDYLVMDLPPGTGDAQLSISQILAISGAVIVTTPQEVSLIDARKGLLTFRQLKVPVLGIVENMSYLMHGNERIDIFRSGGGRRVAEELEVPFLGEIPLDPKVVVGGDEGRPIVEASPDAPTSQAYFALAREVIAKLEEAEGEGRPSTTPILPGPIQWK